MNRYTEWTAQFLAKNNGMVMGLCQSTCQQMREAFPELVIIRGHVLGAFPGRRQHWWLQAPDGEVVDPTVSQYPGAAVVYEPYVPGERVRVGRCMNCGDDIMSTLDDDMRPHALDQFCSDVCSNIMVAEFNAMLGHR